jgi:hypothetical protein
MPFVAGFLRVRRRGHPDQGLPGGEGPVDPDYGIGEEHPDQGLPGGGLYPDQGLPTPPPGVWPPLTPSHPIQPAPPGTPPGSIWPPVGGPSHPIAPGDVGPGQGLPRPPGAPDQGLPARPVGPDQGLPKPQTYWVVCGIPGVGWRYVCVDPSLSPTHPIAPGGPVAQPK